MKNMNNKKIVIMVFTIVVFVLFLIYWGHYRLPSQNWREYRSLVRLWPRAKNEKIESIRFCDAPYSEIAKSDEDSFISFFKKEIIETYGLRTRDENDVKSWHITFGVPKENLDECIKIIDKAMKGTKSSWLFCEPVMHMIWQERMLIVTNKGKYIVNHVDVRISNVDRPEVYGDEWKSYELGEYLKKCGFPIPEVNHPEQKRSE